MEWRPRNREVGESWCLEDDRWSIHNRSHVRVMLVRVPSLPSLVNRHPRPTLTHAEIIDRVSNFISAGNVTVLTGAGVSVDSGIKAYRGHDGRYLNPNFKLDFLLEFVLCTSHFQAFILSRVGCQHPSRLCFSVTRPPMYSGWT